MADFSKMFIPTTSDTASEKRMQERQAVDELTAPGGRTARFWWGWGTALVVSMLIVVLVTLPPFVGEQVKHLLMQGFAVVCHQLPSRSPHIDGVQLAVCHRCYGIYWGILLAVLGFLVLARWSKSFGRHAPKLLLLSLVPLTIDWLLGVMDIWYNTPASRGITGAVFGLVAGYYFAQACTQLFTPAPVLKKDHATVSGSSV